MDTKQAILQIADAIGQSPSKQRKAKMWLVVRLLDNDTAATRIYADGLKKGFTRATLRRASKGLVRHYKMRGVMGGEWMWALLPKFDTRGFYDYREEVVNRLLEVVR